MSVAVHCDRKGCNAWQRASDLTFLTLRGGGSITEHHFCTLDCLTQWTATNTQPNSDTGQAPWPGDAVQDAWR